MPLRSLPTCHKRHVSVDDIRLCLEQHTHHENSDLLEAFDCTVQLVLFGTFPFIRNQDIMHQVQLLYSHYKATVGAVSNRPFGILCDLLWAMDTHLFRGEADLAYVIGEALWYLKKAANSGYHLQVIYGHMILRDLIWKRICFS